MASLVLVRHGQSQWNEKNLFTGWKDPDLTEKGVKEAIETGLALKESGYQFDIMFTSVLLRAKRTGNLILEQMGQEDLKTFENEALNERNYGDLAGLNKDKLDPRYDVVLIYPPWAVLSGRVTLQNSLPPMGIISIASYLESLNFSVVVYDHLFSIHIY